jgi:hypothetical protein
VTQYLELIVQPLVFPMLIANPKYWGTWQLRMSYRLEENDMTVDEIKFGSPQQRPANPLAAIIQAKLGVRTLSI